jgi:hypothetical protein
MTIYCLDRNAIITIIQYNAKPPTSPKRRRNVLKLKEIDKNDAIITPILSATEGALGRPEAIEQKKKTVIKETEAIKKFFRYARIDDTLSTKLLEQFSQIDISQHFLSYDNYNLFLKEALPLIVLKIKEQDKRAISEKIKSIANKFNVHTQHPVVLATILTAFGSDICRKIIKPKNFSNEQYNTINDLIIISQLLQFNAMSKQYDDVHNYELITFDESLKCFYESITPIKASINETDSQTLLQFNINIDLNKLIPNINEDNIGFIYQLLSNGTKNVK